MKYNVERLIDADNSSDMMTDYLIKDMCLGMVDNMSIENIKKLFNVEVINPFMNEEARSLSDKENELLRKYNDIKLRANIEIE